MKNGDEAAKVLDMPTQKPLKGYSEFKDGEQSCGNCAWRRSHNAVHPLSGKAIQNNVCIRFPPTVHPLPEVTEQVAASLVSVAEAPKPKIEFKPTSMFPWVLKEWVCGEWRAE